MGDAGASPPVAGGSPRQVVRGPLQPIELATAAVLGAMTVVLVLAGAFIPHASAVAALGVVPMGVIACFHRPRAVLAGVVASTVVALIVAGTGVVSTVVLCGLLGGLAGHARARRWGVVRVVAGSLVLGPTMAAGADGVLLLFSSLRRLTFHQLLATWKGLVDILGRLLSACGVNHQVSHHVTHGLDRWAIWAVGHWWALIAVVGIACTVGATLLIWWALEPIVARLEQLRSADRLAGAGDPDAHTRRHLSVARDPVAPLPVRLDDVTVRYAGATEEALGPVSLTVDPGRLVAVLGPNGSGKSTLARVLAGVPPTDGTVTRPGRAGLGLVGGVAVIAQRPESQVLGVTVADDIVWGLPRHVEVDVAGLLAGVGLAGLESKETAGLSGGQLQRLAIASALARRPALLLSDESTAMVDVDGRHSLMRLLARLPEERGMTVVHVTHRLEETDGADRVLQLERGRLVGDDSILLEPVIDRTLPAPPPARRPAVNRPSRPEPGDGRVPATLRLVDVSHIYAPRTPWAATALRHVDLEIRGGEGVLVVGGNGSGKSTLAWVLAGLLRPTEGRCLLGSRPVTQQVGAVGMAFQHARLQVQRSTVGKEVQAAGGVGRAGAEEALGLVGLDPGELWSRSVDQLSGGQLRRLALAGLLAHRPEVLVLDEPLAGLDDASREALGGVLADLRRRTSVTLVIVSHETHTVADVCDRLVALRHGRVVADERLVAGTTDRDLARFANEEDALVAEGEA